MHRRTLIMVLLAALAGLRVHEIAKVRGEDVDIDDRTLRVTGKGGRSDTLPLHPLLVAAALTMPTRGWWFPANARRPGDHVHAKSVSDIIGQAMLRAEIPGTPHGLRHWYGTNLVATGADLRTAQTLLRHANLQTTAIYIAVADQKRSEAVDKLNPYG
jgi:integrase/recombinase XerD